MMSTEVFQMRNENERFVEMGKRIRARRLSLKMKQMELAEKVDISNNHISSIERGIERPGLDSFIRICDVLDVTPDYLLLGSMKSNNVPKNITDNLKLNPAGCYGRATSWIFSIQDIWKLLLLLLINTKGYNIVTGFLLPVCVGGNR